MDIKLFVDKDVTSCAQLRIKKTGSDMYFFECGIDMVYENMFIANYPPVYGDSFAELVRNILTWKVNVYRRGLADIDSLLICDDTEAAVPSPSCFDGEDEEELWSVYRDVIYERTHENKENLKKSPRAFSGLRWNEDDKRWEGVVLSIN